MKILPSLVRMAEATGNLLNGTYACLITSLDFLMSCSTCGDCVDISNWFESLRKMICKTMETNLLARFFPNDFFLLMTISLKIKNIYSIAWLVT